MNRKGKGTAGQRGARAGAACDNREPKERAERDQQTWGRTFRKWIWAARAKDNPTGEELLAWDWNRVGVEPKVKPQV